MTVSNVEIAAPRTQTRRLLSRVGEPALAVLAFALLCGAWLAFFWFVPFDFTPPRAG